MLLIKPTKRLELLTASCLVFVLLGCHAEVEHPIVFEPNLVHTMKYQIQKDIPMDEASKDSTWVVDTMFGSPDEPKLPTVVTEDEELGALISQSRLMRASGSATAEGRGLFRMLCSNCHGVTGNGRGKDASAQMPYPRDYRMGIFKFKSTPRGSKPTRDDLARARNLVEDPAGFEVSGRDLHQCECPVVGLIHQLVVERLGDLLANKVGDLRFFGILGKGGGG